MYKETTKPQEVPTISAIQNIAKKKNKKPLTTKQALFVQNVIKEPNISEAGRNAYPKQTLQSAVQQGHENMKKPQIQNVLAELMDSKGLTDGYLIERLTNGIENGKDEGFNHLKLAFELKGKLQKVNVNLSHTIKESRKSYEL